MPKFRITPARGEPYEVEAQGHADAATKIVRDGKRNLFGSEGARSSRFFLDRGPGPLWPISVGAAAVELSMGGF